MPVQDISDLMYFRSYEWFNLLLLVPLSVLTVMLGSWLLSEVPVAEVDCQPGRPCQYPEEVDFRIIVLAYKR